MRKLSGWILLLVLAALPAFAAGTKGEWTGYITDTHCGSKGASKSHTADCVDKCMKSGSKAQIMNESDNKAYDLSEFSKDMRPLVGKKVTVKGTLDDKNTIKVDSVAEAK